MEAPSTRRVWMRRIAPLLLVAGLGIAVAPLLGSFPREREVDIRVSDAADVVGIDLTWTEAPGGEGDALQASSWRFAPGTAPRSLRTTVRLPDGAYDVAITVSRTLGSESTHRAITLGDADRITLPIR